MKVCIIQNDPIVLLGTITEWVEKNNHEVEIYESFNDDQLPDTDDFDLAIILGGRMGAYEEKDYPAVAKVKEWTEHNINEDKHIFGICLGAQIIADVTGGKTTPHDKPEVGWYDIDFNDQVNSHHLLNNNVDHNKFYEFHFDAFELPDNAIVLGSSERTKNQIFAIGNKVLGTQFHPEFNAKSITDALEHTNEEKSSKYYAQTPEEMVDEALIKNSKRWLFNVLDNFETSIKREKSFSN